MVKGLQLFKNHFQLNTHQYVLIGGTACDLAMSGAGLSFRATKDLDVVLFTEALDPDFGRIFWEFIGLGGYARRERDSGGRQYYRFQKPTDPEYPVMIELFSKIPDGLVLPPESALTPIPVGDDISSLSAILLDETYYGFLRDGKIEFEGLPIVGAEHLIVLKAKAWLDLSNRKSQGEAIDQKNILKHKRDIFRLFQIVDPEFRLVPAAAIQTDLAKFLNAMRSDDIDLKTLGIQGMALSEVLDSIAQMFAIP